MQALGYLLSKIDFLQSLAQDLSQKFPVFNPHYPICTRHSLQSSFSFHHTLGYQVGRSLSTRQLILLHASDFVVYN